MSDYEVHPVAALFPMMAGSAFESLKADIHEHGQREAITTWKGMIVDGRNRLRACEELGIEPTIGEMDDDADPVPWIISINLHRRHLTESQRAMIASELATMKRGNQPNPPIGGFEEPAMSTFQAATALQVSERSIDRAKSIKRDAAPEVVELVKSGEITVNAAKNLTKAIPDKAEQSKVAAQGPKAVKDAAKKSQPPAEKKTLKPEPPATPKAEEPAVDVSDAVQSLQKCKNPCKAIETWLKSATQEQVSIIWTVVDELLSK